MNDEIQTRDAIQTRSLPDQPVMEGDYLTGYCVVYGEISNGKVADRPDGRGNYFYEQIDKDAFTESLQNRNIRFIYEHDNKSEYADTDSGTLTLTPDEKGIQFRCLIPEYARHLKAKLDSGILKGMSFGFKEKDAEYRDGVKVIKKGELFHISPTFSPAYTSAKFTNTKKNNLASIKRKLELEKKK